MRLRRELVDGPLAGLLARSVVVVNPAGEIVYTELVPETTNEPNLRSSPGSYQVSSYQVSLVWEPDVTPAPA